MIENMPKAENYNHNIINSFEDVKETITAIRNIRKEKNIPQKESLKLFVKGDNKSQFDAVLLKLGNISKIENTDKKIEEAISFIIKSDEYFIPLGELVNIDEEIAKMKEELAYTKGFLKSVEKKLSNDSFVNNAPEKVVNIERKKKKEAEEKIVVIEERIASLEK